jgi:peptide/nickel transport system substrate-binding protein
VSDNPMSRRGFLGVVAGASLAGLALSACGSNGGGAAGSASASAKAAGTPKRGGTLRLGVLGGSSSDGIDADNPIGYPDFARVAQLFDPLVQLDGNARQQLVLAEEITPDAAAKNWTIRLRSGITFHDGKPLTAADVIYTLRRIVDPKSPLEGASGLATMDAAGLKALDKLTVRVPMKQPYAILPETLAQPWFYIVPERYTSAKPVGTGAYVYKSFTPGNQSTFTRNPNYWQQDLPYADEVVIIDFADATSQMNALAGGSVDIIDQVDGTLARTLTSAGAQLAISQSGSFLPITMRMDQPPFNDTRVRQAMRLLVDRQQLIDVALGGYGSVGNDVFGRWDPAYDSELPQRKQDISEAKSLLKAADHASLSVTFTTAPIANDAVNEATVFAQQAAQAGVTVSVSKVTSDVFFGKSYLSWPLAQDWWSYFPYLNQVSQSMLSNSPYNEGHWDVAKYTSLYNQAVQQLDTGKRAELIHQMQTMDYDSGPYIIPYFVDALAGHSPKVSGIGPSKPGLPLNNYDLKSLWLS